jgi:hypothetical protein
MRRHIAKLVNVAALMIVLLAGAARGDPPAGAPGQQAPVNATLPSISGALEAGSVLTADPGAWEGKGLKYAYQWMRCDPENVSCSAVESATSSTYTLEPDDAGRRMRVVVTASNHNGSSAATSEATAVIRAAPSEPPPPPPPSSTPPSNDSPPTISGPAQEGQTLSAAAGAWSGTTPLGYAYQWQRCNPSGDACAAIAGATETTYLLVALDVGSTIRVSVTASNSAGSATASSAPTAIVTIPPPPPPPPEPSQQPYLLEEFGGSLPGTWQVWPLGSVPSLVNSVGNGSGGKAARLICTPTSSGPNPNSELTSLYLNNTDSRIHTARGEETWYRVRIRFPSGKYFPTTGQWNWHVEWHNDDHTASYGSYSTAMGVYTDYPVVAGQVGTSPRLALRLAGGLSSSPTYESHELPLGSLRYDHWYDIVFRIVWGTDKDGTGRIGWWVDGTQRLSKSFPILQRNPDGTVDHPGFGIYNYRLHDPSHTSEVHFDSVLIGPSAESVGFGVSP